MVRSKFTLAACVVGCGLAAASAPGLAQDKGAGFFKGKTISILVGASGGGSATNYAMALKRNMANYLPGHPTMIVKNMPGAGGLVVANHIYNVARNDGSVFGITSRTFVFANLIGKKNARFDARKFSWIGSSAIEYSTCFSWHTSPVKTLDDLRHTELVVGAAGKAGTAATFGKMANKVIGTKIKTITGYRGSAGVVLALERGEVKGYCGLAWTYIKLRKPKWISEKKINLLFQMGPSKHPDLPNVPLITDVAKTPEDRQVIEFILKPQTIGRPFFGPPGMPADRLAALRTAFKATLEDPKYLKDAKQLRLDVGYVSGEDALKVVEGLYALPPKVISRAKAIMK